MRRIDRPTTGYFKVRAYRAGPWLPAQIMEDLPIDPSTGEMMDRSVRLQAFVNGLQVPINDVWFYGREITREEFKWLTAVTPIGIPKPKRASRYSTIKPT